MAAPESQTPVAAEPAAVTELEHLRRRVTRLAQEKSYLQLILRMTERINPAASVPDMVDDLLHNIVDSIGGTDIKIWYWVDQVIHFASILGDRCNPGQIDDALAERVRQSRQFVEQSEAPTRALMQGGALSACWTWCFPLLTGTDLIGIVKLENVHIAGESLRTHLPIFFSHAALILSHQIRSQQRWQALDALRQKTQELDDFFNNSLDLFCIADRRGHFLKLNPAWHEALGYHLDDLQGRSFMDFVHPDDRAMTLDILQQLGRPDAVARFCNRYRHKDGSWRWIEWQSRPQGRLIYAAARDVTDKKRAEEALRLAASVFANSQEGILITAADNRIIDVNDAFTRITGFARSEVIGRNPSLLRSGRQDAAFYARMWHDIGQTGSWRGEIWNRRKSGEVFAEMLSINAVHDATNALLHFVGTFSDISRLKAHEAQLERIAHFDLLTGLPNRRLLADRLHQELARTRRSSKLLGLCFVDLDGFKRVNDELGHDAGDALLVEISQRLQSASRAGDTVARIGGDEFVLLLSELAHEDECFQAVERLLLEVVRPVQIGRHQVRVSASIGVTLFPYDDNDAETLMRHADQAMYQAKLGGKGQFRVYDVLQQQRTQAEQETWAHLLLALEQQELLLLYQPKVDLCSGRILGVEGLLRWQHPSRGLLLPAAFLPLVIDTELEIPLSQWVLETALSQIERWHQDGLTLSVSVNVSMRHLLNPTFVAWLGAALARHPTVRLGELELEILESMALENLAVAAPTLTACAALGVRCTLDGFGSGLSSLIHLRRLPLRLFKIDQSYVSGMLDDPEHLERVENAVAVAGALRRPVLAEGVASAQHAALLLRLGCVLGQGDGIAPPMPAAQLPAWIAHCLASGLRWAPAAIAGPPATDLLLDADGGLPAP